MKAVTHSLAPAQERAILGLQRPGALSRMIPVVLIAGLLGMLPIQEASAQTDVALSHVVDVLNTNTKLVRITFTVRNVGAAGATGVTVTLDDFDVVMASTHTGIAQFISTTKGAIVGRVWQVGALAPGDVESMTLEAPLDVSHTFDGGARVSGLNEVDANAGNDAVAYTIRQSDHGDLPDTYTTLRVSGGPEHEINPTQSPRLGVLVDSEEDGLPTGPGNGDDIDEILNDEDGVEIETILGMGFQALTAVNQPLRSSVGYNVQFTVRGTPGTYYVSAFLDRNADGDFDLPTEAYFLNQAVTVGAMGFATFIPNDKLVFDIPTWANVGYLRVRVCDSDANACDTPGGFVNNGEVEDYFVTVNQSDLFDFGDAPLLYAGVTVFPAGAHHQIGTLRLGSRIDGEYDAQPSINADGDGSDEDGITFITQPLVQGGTGQFIFEATGNGVLAHLNAWIDFNGDGDLDDPGENIMDDQPVRLGVAEPVGFAVPDLAVLRQKVLARFRLCASSGECDTPIGLASSGEVEDYVVEIGDESDVFVIDADNPSLVSPITMSVNNGILTIQDSMSPTPNVLFSAPLLKAGMIDITAPELTLDFSNGDPVPQGGLNFTGTGDDATLRIVAGGFPGIYDVIQHIFDNDHDGSISLDGKVISYQGLAPVIDLLPADSRIFTYPGGVLDNKHIVVTPNGDGASNNGVSFIDCIGCGEEASFLNPRETLTINTGDGADSVFVSLLDNPIPPNFERVTIEVGEGPDYVLATPSANYEYAINGDRPPITPGACPALSDALDIATLGIPGATLAYTDLVAGDGIWTFGAPHQQITFQGFERQLDADSRLDLLVTPDLVYPTQSRELLIIVSNTGPVAAKCASVNIPAEILSLVDANPATFPAATAPFVITGADQNGAPINVAGASYDPGTSTLSLPSVGAGHTIRMAIDLTSVVNFELMPRVWGIELFEGGASRDQATFRVAQGFFFPVQTHVNSATFIHGKGLSTFTGGGVATAQYEQLIVGLLQGSPSQDGAVWCRVPTAADVNLPAVWNAPAGFTGGQNGSSRLWRPCSGVNVPDDPSTPNVDESTLGGELPFPLHVNGLLDTDLSTPLDPFNTNRRLWLGTWGGAGLYFSDDGAETWRPAWSVTGPLNAALGDYWTVNYAITKDADGFLYTSGNAGHVIRSLDNGGTWQLMPPLPHAVADTPWSLTAHPTVPGVVYAGTFGRGVLVTLDYGFTWKVLDEAANDKLFNVLGGETAGHIFDLEFGPVNDEYLYAGTGNGVWRARFNIGDTDDIDGDWQFLGPEVDFVSPSGVVQQAVPEVHALAFRLNPNPELVVGTWGVFADADGDLISAFTLDDPFEPVPGDFTGFKLRTSQVNFIATSSSGEVVLGGADGVLRSLDSAATAVTVTATEDEPTALPTQYELKQNYPNPFNPVTTIQFALPESGSVRLAVFDMLGREVALLVDASLSAGEHRVTFDAKGLPTGTYIYRMDTIQGSFERRLVLVK